LLLDLLDSNVLDTDRDDLLLITKTNVELFLLVDLEDVEVTAAASASQDLGDHGAVAKSAARVISSTAVEKLVRAEGSKDGLVLASGEVDGLVDFVDLVAFMAELVESLGPRHFTLFFLAGSLERGRVVLARKTKVISSLQGMVVPVVFFGLGLGRFRRLFSLRLVLSLVLVGGLVRTGLTDGVVSFALSVNRLLDGLEEESRIVILVLKTDRVGSPMNVSFEDEVGSDRVNNDLRDLSPLNVDEGDGEVLLNLDRGWDTLLQSDEDGRLKGPLHFGKKLHLCSLLHIAFTGVEFLFGLVNFNILGLDGQFSWRNEPDVELVLDFDSGMLVVNDRDSLHHATTHGVHVLGPLSPGIVGRHDSSQDCQGEKADGHLHIEGKNSGNFG
jgi:hypothetical protein